MRSKKSKFFKAFGFSSLALLVGFGTTMAFAPLGASPSVAKASEMSTQASESLIVPKKDDPVIFTTESGIEIKWGNAASATGGGKESASYSYSSYTSGVGLPTPQTPYSNLTSGNLSGFPYFTTTSGSTTYTWVIIGQNPNLNNGAKTYSDSKSSSKTEYKTLSDWQAKINSSDTYDNFIAGYSPTHKAFFNNTYEANTPAGIAIKNNGILNQTTARTYSASMSYNYTINKLASSKTVKSNAEIPSGCVLCLSNTIVGSCKFFNTTPAITSSTYCFGGSNNVLTTNCKNYYTNDTFGFGSLKSSLQNISLKQMGTYNADPYNNYSNTCSLYFFPLGFGGITNTNKTVMDSSVENFQWTTYLTADQYKTGDYIWARSMFNSYHGFWADPNGSWTVVSGETYWGNTNRGVRPACVLKIT